jgi:hypothetical protein
VRSGADPALDVAKIVAMLLIHDIVEIDAGDAPIHANYDAAAPTQSEEAAAKRIFGLLPETQQKVFLSLRRAFEAAETTEARFAKAFDRFQRFLLNTLNDGGTWASNGVTEDQVCDRSDPMVARPSTRSPALRRRGGLAAVRQPNRGDADRPPTRQIPWAGRLAECPGPLFGGRSVGISANALRPVTPADHEGTVLLGRVLTTGASHGAFRRDRPTDPPRRWMTSTK